MGLLTAISAFFRGSALLTGAVEFIKTALTNKYVLIAIGMVAVLWVYDTKVQAEYTAKHAQQELEVLQESLEGYKSAFSILANHVAEVYKERKDMETEVEAPLPTYDEVIEDTKLATLEEDIQVAPVATVKHIDAVTLKVFDSIESKLNEGVGNDH